MKGYFAAVAIAAACFLSDIANAETPQEALARLARISGGNLNQSFAADCSRIVSRMSLNNSTTTWQIALSDLKMETAQYVGVAQISDYSPPDGGSNVQMRYNPSPASSVSDSYWQGRLKVAFATRNAGREFLGALNALREQCAAAGRQPPPSKEPPAPQASQKPPPAPAAPQPAQKKAAVQPPPPTPEVETIIVDGVTYVRGREPQPLGTLPASDATRESDSSQWTDADIERRNLPRKKGHWATEDFLVNEAGANRLFVRTYLYATYVNEAGNPSCYGPYIQISNGSPTYPAYFGLAGVLNNMIGPRQQTKVYSPVYYNKNTPCPDMSVTVKYWVDD